MSQDFVGISVNILTGAYERRQAGWRRSVCVRLDFDAHPTMGGQTGSKIEG
jgi:hypothetical protein